MNLLSFNQLAVNINYRWLYGSLMILFVLFNKDNVYIPGLTQSQFLFGLSIVALQYFIVNTLLAAWTSAKKFASMVLVLGLVSDFSLIGAINYLLGSNNAGTLIFYLFPIVFTAYSRVVSNTVFTLSLITNIAVLYLQNSFNVMSQGLINTILNTGFISLLFMGIRFLTNSIAFEVIKNVRDIVHEIRNSLTVILGYINILHSENVPEVQKFKYYEAIETATKRIHMICNKFNAFPGVEQKKTVMQNSQHTTSPNIAVVRQPAVDSQYVNMNQRVG